MITWHPVKYKRSTKLEYLHLMSEKEYKNKIREGFSEKLLMYTHHYTPVNKNYLLKLDIIQHCDWFS